MYYSDLQIRWGQSRSRLIWLIKVFSRAVHLLTYCSISYHKYKLLQLTYSYKNYKGMILHKYSMIFLDLAIITKIECHNRVNSRAK
jgi:hypothetical protein